MAREHPAEIKGEVAPQVVEREVTLSLLNAKLNEIINLIIGEIDKEKAKE